MEKDNREELVCVECGNKYVVNKKYRLCNGCNFKRTHKGRSKHEVYTERSLLRISQRQINQNKEKGERSRWNKSKNKINLINAKITHHCSDGSLVTQSEIKYNLIETYIQIDSERESVCEGCNRSLPLSHSHTISQARCKQLGKTELIWDKENIFLECFDVPCSYSTYCHNIWSNGDLEKKKRLLNFGKKLEYIKIHDPETYQKLTWSQT